MVLDYAKTRSDATVQREGGSDELEAHKRRRMAEKGVLNGLPDRYGTYKPMLTTSVLQSGNKPKKRSKHRRNSSVPPPPLNPHAQPRQPRELVSSRPLVPRLQSFRTSTYHPTRFCSCGSCPTRRARRACLLSLVISKDSRKSEWCPAERGLLSSSTRPRLEQSARRRLRLACPWASRASRFASLTSVNSRWHVASYKISLSRSFWRLEGLVLNVCIRNTESVNPTLLLSQCIKVVYHMEFNTS